MAPNPDPREAVAGLSGRAPRGPRWASGGFHRTLLRPPRGSFSTPCFFFSEQVRGGEGGRDGRTKASEKTGQLPMGLPGRAGLDKPKGQAGITWQEMLRSQKKIEPDRYPVWGGMPPKPLRLEAGKRARGCFYKRPPPTPQAVADPWSQGQQRGVCRLWRQAFRLLQCVSVFPSRAPWRKGGHPLPHLLFSICLPLPPAPQPW